MFKKTELEVWWDRLDPKTKDYLKSQPMWHNTDLYKALAVGVCIGIMLGVVVGYELGFTPASQTTTYLKG